MAFAFFVALLVSNGAALDAQETEPRPRYSTAVGRIGAGRYAPGEWGAVSFEILNPTSEPVELVAGLYFDREPNLQFGRKVWIPPMSKRMSWYPIYVPETTDISRNSVVAMTFMLDVTDGKNEWIRARDGEVFDSAMLPLKTEPVTVVVADRDGENPTLEMVISARVARNVDRKVTQLFDAQLPGESEALKSIEHLVLASNWVKDEPATLDAIRRYVQGGGQLWIMLDQVEPETVELLLGDAFQTTVLDTIPLVETQIVVANDDQTLQSDSEPRTFEEPVPLVRTIPHGVDVAFKQGEWPAAMWQKYGAGQILYTTLGPRAWMRPRTPTDPQPSDPNRSASFFALNPVRGLTTRLMDRNRKAMDTDELFDTYIEEHIGYSIVGKRTVLGLLFGFCGLLLIVGLVLSRREKMESLAWLTPLISLSVAGVFAFLGLTSQKAVPPTLAVAEYAELSPGSPDITFRGRMASFQHATTKETIGISGGGLFMPDRSGLETEPIRLLWQDYDEASWDPLALPTGMRTATHGNSERLPSPVFLESQFGENGLDGKLTVKGIDNVSDLVLALPNLGSLRVTLAEDGSFTSGTQDILAPGEFVSGTVLSDEQRRRQEVYRKLFGDENPPIKAPTLFAWADPLKDDLVFPEVERVTGGLLMSIPLQISPTPPQQPVTIPPPFITFRSTAGPNGEIAAAVYDRQSNEWLESKNRSKGYFRFSIPKEVQPLKVESATLTVEIDASSRPLDVYGFQDGKNVELGHLDGPVGRFEIPLDNPDVLQIDDEGGILLGVFVGEHEEAASGGATNWQYKNLMLEVKGTTVSTDE